MSALWMKNPNISPGQVHEAYAEKLRKDGIAEAEVQHRLSTQRAFRDRFRPAAVTGPLEQMPGDDCLPALVHVHMLNCDHRRIR